MTRKAKAWRADVALGLVFLVLSAWGLEHTPPEVCGAGPRGR
jgi:hypothetical protein